ncbi:dihydrofolate reductase [Pannonibacter indicus]|uniref:dihydrofolate reductase n=1 Tax=Pannonibacter indicus TaxID=466044 RepID=UPI00391D60C3
MAGNRPLNALKQAWSLFEVVAEMRTKKIVMPSISFIVARSFPGDVIGCENELPWRLKTDLKNFKSVTKGKAIIMGRRTFDSIGKPLPNRKNIVLSRTPSEAVDGVVFATSVEEALFEADFYSITHNADEFFVIGGDQIYRKFGELYQKIYLTEVFSDNIHGDAFFRDQYDRRQWKIVSEKDFPRTDEDEFPFRLTVFERRNRTVRMFSIDKFYKEYSEKIEKLNDMEKAYLERGVKRRTEVDVEERQLFPAVVC